MTRILFVGGGSGGHIFPLIAVWQELHKKRGVECTFVCSLRPEDAEYLKAEGIEPHVLASPRASWTLPFTFPRAYFRARRLLRKTTPDVIFSKGGSLSVPLCLAAHNQRIPIVLHESDAVMGKANRLIARWATCICLGLEGAMSYEMSATSKKGNVPFSKLKTQNSKLILTGNPIRTAITSGSVAEGRRITGFDGKRPVLLIYGGSQGAQSLNAWTIAHLEELLSFTQVIHLTGKGKQGAAPRAGYYVSPFAFDALPHLYAVSECAVSRAGSGTIGELAANGIPAILIPLRGLAQDHQELNARAAAQSGGCMVVEQSEMERKLLSALRVTLEDVQKRKTMSEKIRSLYHPDAAKTLSRLVVEVAEKHLPEQPKRR